MSVQLLCALALVTGVLSVSARAADYTSYVTYVNFEVRLPGGGGSTSGFNYRTENFACRSGNSGLESAWYVTTDNVLIYTGPQWTNCQTGAYARLTTNGYYRSGCTNEGTVAHTMWCETWNYSP